LPRSAACTRPMLDGVTNHVLLTKEAILAANPSVED
jgi:hypothetical protein